MSAPMFLARMADIAIPDLVAYWDFDEGTGTSLGDVTGGGRTGTVFGTPAWSSGYKGQCMVFDGVDDYVSVADHASLNFGASQDFTVSVWLKTSQAIALDHWPVSVAKNDTSTHWAIILDEQTEPLGWFWQIRIGGVKYTTSSGVSIRDSAWHHLVGMRDGTTLRLWQDNAEKTPLTNAGISGSVSNTSPLTIGKFFGADPQWYIGSIDDLRIYSRALTATEIAALYEGNVI